MKTLNLCYLSVAMVPSWRRPAWLRTDTCRFWASIRTLSDQSAVFAIARSSMRLATMTFSRWCATLSERTLSFSWDSDCSLKWTTKWLVCIISSTVSMRSSVQRKTSVKRQSSGSRSMATSSVNLNRADWSSRQVQAPQAGSTQPSASLSLTWSERWLTLAPMMSQRLWHSTSHRRWAIEPFSIQARTACTTTSGKAAEVRATL